ncbi:hypothetical protein DFP73DRAFT_115864, partial [Morchella snyderi]
GLPIPTSILSSPSFSTTFIFIFSSQLNSTQISSRLSIASDHLLLYLHLLLQRLLLPRTYFSNSKMQMFSMLSLLLVAFAGILVAASPITSPTTTPVPECPSGKPFTGQAGCSSCTTVGNIVCGRDEDRITDLICTSFGTTLTWVPVDDSDKCGVFTPPQQVDGCPSGKPFQETRKACEMCATEGNVVCGLDGQKKADLKCTKVNGALIWVAVGGQCGGHY